MYKTIFNKQLKKCLSGVWFPDCWFTFLAFGAPSDNPAASLWTPRGPRGISKRKQPINVSQQDIIKGNSVTSSSNATSSISSIPTKKAKITYEEVQPYQEQNEDQDDEDSVIEMKRKGPLLKPAKKFQDEVQQIQHNEKIKEAHYKRALTHLTKTKQWNPNYVSTPVKQILEDPVFKAKRLLDDCNNALELYKSGNAGVVDPILLQQMQKTVGIQIVNYFKEVTKQNNVAIPESTPSASSNAFDLSQLT
jgi:hypothetical protein